MTLERRFASDDALEFGVEDLSDQGGILEDHPRELTGSPPEEVRKISHVYLNLYLYNMGYIISVYGARNV